MTEPSGSRRSPIQENFSSALCAVCGSPNHGTHFGVLSCRACSSFFRRTIFERKTYKCRKCNTCDILKSGSRNACRACRLQHCLRAGMHVDPDVSSKSSTIDQSLPGLFCASKVKLLVELNLETPLLDHYVLGLKNFNIGQRSLFTIENPSTIFSTPQYKYVNQEEYMKMERGSIALLHTMCLNYFDLYDSLTQEQKINILKYFWGQFTFIHHAFLTCLYFNASKKDGEDIVVDRIVTHYGCYIDLDSIKFFYKDPITKTQRPKKDQIDNYEDHIRFIEPLLQIAFQNVKKMLRLRINEQEIAAIIGILFWNTVERFGLLNDQMEEKRKAIIIDLNNMEVKNFGFQEGVARAGRLFCYAQEITVTRIEMNDTLDVGKIFLPLFRDVWDDEICPVPALFSQNCSTETKTSDV